MNLLAALHFQVPKLSSSLQLSGQPWYLDPGLDRGLPSLCIALTKRMSRVANTPGSGLDARDLHQIAGGPRGSPCTTMPMQSMGVIKPWTDLRGHNMKGRDSNVHLPIGSGAGEGACQKIKYRRGGDAEKHAHLLDGRWNAWSGGTPTDAHPSRDTIGCTPAKHGLGPRCGTIGEPPVAIVSRTQAL
jgi:hypothetical protein